MGDFNAITTHHEKEGGKSKSNTSIQDFNDFINSGNLMDLGYEGEKFTWCNRQFGGNLIRERLHRVLVSRSWREEFPNAYVTHLEDFGSDHRPLLLCEERQIRKNKRRFRFQERWCENEDVVNLIKQAWKHEIEGSSMFRLAGKLKHCRHKLVEWQKNSLSNSLIRIQSIKTRLAAESSKGILADPIDVRILEAELEDELIREEWF
ncbi:uncharacterized protein LOC130980978 [Arachis stenosperma]|uniref:uncharacterized protein LOC130980978 n=1 Tax=Arachis stenosperma TaxID=217475 RepID=UPI0025ABF9FB|nr:uncharacterized protein LOC130980978 [Arachis stenosperma]